MEQSIRNALSGRSREEPPDYVFSYKLPLSLAICIRDFYASEMSLGKSPSGLELHHGLSDQGVGSWTGIGFVEEFFAGG